MAIVSVRSAYDIIAATMEGFDTFPSDERAKVLTCTIGAACEESWNRELQRRVTRWGANPATVESEYERIDHMTVILWNCGTTYREAQKVWECWQAWLALPNA